jgi:hypothetical protein
MAEKFDRLNSDAYLSDLTLIEEIYAKLNLSSRKDVIRVLCNHYRGNSQSASEKTESSTLNSMDLVPTFDLTTLLPCNHREIVPPQESDKNHIEYWCVFRRSCIPIQAKEIKHLRFCRSCQSQQYQLPASHSAETEADKPEPEPEQIKPVVTIPMQSNWNSKYANVRKADGSRICPFSVDPKFPKQCYLCKLKERQKYEECVQLHALIAINAQNTSL